MKGQLLQTHQPARSNSHPPVSHSGTRLVCPPHQKACASVFCVLFIAMAYAMEHRILAGESTNSPRRNAIIVPNELASNGDSLVINPSSTNRVSQDGLVIASTEITDHHEMLRLYADVRGRTVLWSANLSLPNVNFTADKPLTRTETITALDAFFALNGIAFVDIGEKWVKAARSESCQTGSNLVHQTEYVAHLQHLTYVKPSELLPILQPFCSVPNAVFPLNADQAVLLRDFPQNVQKIRDVIREVDVAVPIEFISEVIPIKYAKASDIAAALNKSAPLEWRASHRPAAENIVVSGQDKLIADERTNSLLVYASLEEMKQIKEIIAHLDLAAAQILIEAVIIEVNRDNHSKISAIDNANIPWMTNFISSVVTNAPLPTTSARSKKSAQVAGFYRFAAISNDLDSFVTTLASNGAVRILQRPRIQTSDKEPAQLFVGESTPYPSGSYTCGSSMQSFNLGVTLELNPSITNDHLVALDIHQTIEEANGSVFIDNVGEVPITRRSERSAKITVRDRDLVLLDGSIERDNTPPRPGKLKRVLTLNGLFHHSKSVTNQNEFIVLIRPTILPTPEVTAQLSKAEKDRMPGVRRAETEIQSEEANRLKELEKILRNDRD